ncbi:MAG TPA: hypothetical protein VLW49_06490 [Gaiellaceae bacterium]|nr:hypothetical protein [Gaiellaceae bacterium]
MRRCGSCDGEVRDEFRFCPHCGTAQRTKIVEYFAGHPDVDDGGLRVSLYLTQPKHVRLSIWRGERADAAISLDPHETRRLARFLLATPGTSRRRIARLLARL